MAFGGYLRTVVVLLILHFLMLMSMTVVCRLLGREDSVPLSLTRNLWPVTLLLARVALRNDLTYAAAGPPCC